MPATTTFRAYKCPECNAPLTVDEAATDVKCDYCGHTFRVARQRPAPAPPPPVATPAARPSSSLRWLPWLTTLLPIAIVGITFWRSGMFDLMGLTSHGSGPGSGGAAPFGEHLQWDPQAGAPLVVDLDGDGVEDVIGRYRLLRGTTNEVWVGGFTGSDFSRRWAVGPLGGLETAQAVQLAVSGKRVLVTDAHQTARLFDLDGKPLGSVGLSDRAQRVCGAPAGAQFFVETVDGQTLAVDGANVVGRAGARPEWCPVSRRPSASGVPTARGFRASYVLRDGARAVAVGVKSPGTRVGMLVGFAAGAKTIDWSRVVATVDPALVSDGEPARVELRGGVVYAYYELHARGGRLAAIDAASGATRWDVLLPRSDHGSGPSAIGVGERRVYVPHWTWLDVLDASSGAVLGTIGRW